MFCFVVNKYPGCLSSHILLLAPDSHLVYIIQFNLFGMYYRANVIPTKFRYWRVEIVLTLLPIWIEKRCYVVVFTLSRRSINKGNYWEPVPIPLTGFMSLSFIIGRRWSSRCSVFGWSFRNSTSCPSIMWCYRLWYRSVASLNYWTEHIWIQVILNFKLNIDRIRLMIL